MGDPLSISVLARRTGVSSKSLRYWERLGLLPRASRTHTGYRLFTPEAARHVHFILKCKSVGLTLREMKQLLEMARDGRNPCPAVMQWIDNKARLVEQQLQSLRAMQRRLAQFRRAGSSVTSCAKEDELCCLIEDLQHPDEKKGVRYAKTVLADICGVGGNRRTSRYRAGIS